MLDIVRLFIIFSFFSWMSFNKTNEPLKLFESSCSRFALSRYRKLLFSALVWFMDDVASRIYFVMLFTIKIYINCAKLLSHSQTTNIGNVFLRFFFIIFMCPWKLFWWLIFYDSHSSKLHEKTAKRMKSNSHLKKIRHIHRMFWGSNTNKQSDIWP